MQPGTTSGDSSGRGAERASRWLLGAACLLAGAGVAVLWLPLRWFHPDPVTPLDVALMRPESGLAFVTECAAAVPSDRGGRSPLRLFEDGRELLPHALHDDIRTRGGGLYSHWGDLIYFSATDGSDPRTNGRRYAWSVPAIVPVQPAEVAEEGLGVAALVGLAGAALGARRRGAAGRWLVAGGLAALAGVTLAAHSGPKSWRAELEGMEGRLADPAEVAAAEPRALAAATPRTLPLLDGTEFIADQAAATPVAQHVPVAIALEPAPGLIGRNTAPCAIPVERVGEVSLRLRVLQGERLLARFLIERRNADGTVEHGALELELPVQARPDWQTVAVRQPLLLQRPRDGTGLETLLIGLELADPAVGGAAARVELGPVLVSGALAPFVHETHGRGRIEAGESLRTASWQGAPGEWARRWPAGAGRRIKGAFAALAEDGDASAEWEVSVEDEDGVAQRVCGGSAAPSAGWVEFAADLPGAAPARLRLRCTSLPAGEVAAWSSVRAIDTSRPARRVLLTLVDTLRADAVTCLGGPAGQTPELDALAAQGVVFEHCYAQANWTRPSIPSIMAGRYVTATGVQLISQRLPERCDTLAEHFFASGFHTVAFLTNSNAGPAAGLQRGFEEMRMVLDRPISQDTATYLAEHVAPRLAQLQDEDLFVYLHLMQVHAPYGPPARPDGWPPAGELSAPGHPVPVDRHLDVDWLATPTAESRRALYRWDVRRLDAEFGSFLREWLGRWEAGRAAPTIVAVMADHGEFLGEHGQWEHGWYRLEPELIHVPLLIRAPGLVSPGSRCADVVQNLDVGATLLDLAGAELPPSEPGRGRSLRPALARGDGLARPFALASGEVNGTRLFTVVTSRGGLVGVDGELLETFDDERERDVDRAGPATLWAAQASLAPAFARSWDRYLAAQLAVHARLHADDGGAAPALDPRALQDLQSLGYMGR